MGTRSYLALTRHPWRLFWSVIAFWTLIGLIFTLQYRSLQAFFDWKETYSLKVLFLWLMPQWYLWALLSFVVFWLADTFPLVKQKLPKHLVLHGCACLVVAFIHIFLDGLLQSTTGPPEAKLLSMMEGILVLTSKKLHTNVLIYWALVVAWHGFYFYQSARDRALETSRLETKLAMAQLEALKSKIQPHFLFNALNGIAAMIHQNPETADTMLVKLSHFLRMTLQMPSGQMTSLGEEMALVEAYLEIEKARFGERLHIQRDLDPSLEDISVPALLLQPLVENAILHGIQKVAGQGQLLLTSKAQGERLALEIGDNGPGPSGQCLGGLGLGATRARLDRIYGRDYELTVEHSELGTRARLSLPLTPKFEGLTS